MFIKKGYVYLFNCSFYTVGPVLSLLLLAIRGFFVQSTFCSRWRVSTITAHRLLPAYYATTIPIDSCGSVTFSFEPFKDSAVEKWGWGEAAASRCLFLSGLTLGECKYRHTVRCDSRESFSIRSGFSDASLLDVRESVRLYRRFFFSRFRDL